MCLIYRDTETGCSMYSNVNGSSSWLSQFSIHAHFLRPDFGSKISEDSTGLQDMFLSSRSNLWHNSLTSEVEQTRTLKEHVMHLELFHNIWTLTWSTFVKVWRCIIFNLQYLNLCFLLSSNENWVKHALSHHLMGYISDLCLKRKTLSFHLCTDLRPW